nr:MAG TPA: hypothetical protein [Caudoviricetes sp.]
MGGGSLKWGPPLVKRDLDYRFLPPALKWVKWVKWVSQFCRFCQFSSNGVGSMSGLAFLTKNCLTVLSNLTFLK